MSLEVGMLGYSLNQTAKNAFRLFYLECLQLDSLH